MVHSLILTQFATKTHDWLVDILLRARRVWLKEGNVWVVTQNLDLYPAFARNPESFISSFFLCPSSSFSPLLHYPIQNLWIPKIAVRCERCSIHSPLRLGSASPHLALSSKVMASEISFRLFSLPFWTDFGCFLCFDFYFSPISSPSQICDLPAAGIIHNLLWRDKNEKSKQTVGKPLKCAKIKAIQVLL